MDEISEYWIAAHFLYKEKWSPAKVDETQSKLVNSIQEVVKLYQSRWNIEWSTNILNVDFLKKNLFVYTPKWDIIELFKWSTILDFAFRIHSEIWLKYRYGKVDGKIVPIDYELKTWNIVEVFTYKYKYTAHENRQSHLKSSSNRDKLHKYLNLAKQDQYAKIWRRMLNEKLKENNLPTLFNDNDKIKKLYTEKELREMFISIYNKKYRVQKLINKIYPENVEKKPKTEDVVKIVTEKAEIVEIEWNYYDYILCPECQPKPKERIIWKICKTTIKIHTIACKALTKVSHNKLLAANWKNCEKNQKYTVNFKIILQDKVWSVMQALESFYEYGVDLREIKTADVLSFIKNSKSKIFTFVIEVSNPSKIHFIKRSLQKKAIVNKVMVINFI